MKTFLRILCVNLFTCLTIGSFAQQRHDDFSTPGTNYWVCPPGVTSITVYLWGSGGMGSYYYSGAGGNMTKSIPIPVTPGQTYQMWVGVPVTDANTGDQQNSLFPTPDGLYIWGNGPSYIFGGSYQPQVFSPSNYIAAQYQGAAGINLQYNGSSNIPAGGGSAASVCANGNQGSYVNNDGSGGFGGVSVQCGQGFWGGNGGNINQVGNWPGGGGGSGYPYKAGAAGAILIYYDCPAPSAGSIANGHTITSPPEMVPDVITSVVDPVLPSGSTIRWQQSTDNINFVTAKTPNTTTTYRFDADNLQTTTYYRRGSNACISGTGFGNWSNTVQIKVINSTSGRNGKITGYVQTRNGAAIASRKVYAQSLTPLKGRSSVYLDSVLTDQQGKFSLDTLFYGDKNYGDSAVVRFKIYADTVGGHLYNPSSAIVNLSALNPTYDLSNQPFRDTSSFAVTGQVYQVCVGCLDNNGNPTTITGAIDSVKVYGTGINHSATNNEKDSSITGYRNPPGQYGNYSLTFQIADQYKIVPKFKNHKFKPVDTSIIVNGNVSNINFNDTSTHVISGFFGAGCNDPIGTAVLEFSDSLPKGIDGKTRASIFRKQVTTQSNGKFSIRLPARAYKVKVISVNVNDPADPSTKESVIKSYFKALPVDSLYRDITISDTVLNLLYQRAPQIAVLGLNADSLRVKTCPTYKAYNFWPQSVKRAITFKVYQGPVSKGCLMNKAGKVYVTTDISNTLGNYNYDTVDLQQGVGIDSIVAAQPNEVINPGTGTYSKKFTATYTDLLGRLVSTDNASPALPITVVTGAAVDPTGTNFVTVSPQIPFLVLHDPPGSASSSSWAKSVTNSQAISFKAQKQDSEGGFVNVKVGLSQIIGLFVEIPVEFWVKVDTKFSTTNTTTNTKESIITNTAEQVIETKDNSAYVASDADLIYGAALNINYKIGTEIEWDSAHCTVLAPRPVMVTDIKNDTTSFLYTQGYIKNQEIPRLLQAAAAQTRPDSIAYFNNQVKVWQQLIDNNEANVKAAPVLQNISFSNGTSQTYSNTLQNSQTNTYDFDLELNRDLAISVGFEFSGTGVDGGYNVGFKMTTGGSTSTNVTTSTTTSYTLADDNAGGPTYEGDYLSVNIKKDPVYGTPMFETVAGGTQCPHEVGTIALDRPVLTSNQQVLTNVKKDTANFTLYLNNLSNDATPNGKRPYILFLNAASNPAGATVLIGGTASPDGVTYSIPNNGGVQPVTVSVIRNSAGGVYNYDNLEFILTDPCFAPVVQGFFSNPHEFSTIKISADFASPVSGINMVSPVNNWVVNQSYHDTIPVIFNGYDTSKLNTVAIQYNIPGNGNWVNITNLAKKKLGKTSTTYNWKISKIADGPYNLRLMVKDKAGSIIYSQPVAGLIDRKPPALYGTPQPASGTYTAGTQISYSYTENINNTNLSSSMVDMRDLTANTPVQVSLSAFGNTLVILPDVNIVNLSGHSFRVIASGVSDLYGNVKTTKDTLYFTVGTSVFATGSDALNITTGKTSIYEDSKGYIDIHFTRNTKVTGPTVVYYKLCGTAVYNQNYIVTYNAGQTAVTGITGMQGTILLPKDSSSVTMYLRPINDSVLTPDKKLAITLTPGGGYSLGSNYSITDSILNHNLSAPIITADKSTTLCAGDSVTLSTKDKIDGTPVTLLWSTGATAKSIKVKTSGTYTVKATAATGFIGYSAPTVVSITCGSPSLLTTKILSKSSVVLNWDAIACAVKYAVQYRQTGKPTWVTDTVNSNVDTLKGLKANTTYEWQVASICKYPAIIISSYTAGTNFTTPVSLTESAVNSTPDYKKAIAGDGFSAGVYPNPATTSANLQVKGMKGEYTVMVESLSGKVLWKAEKLTDNYIQLPLANFSAGVYMVIVFDGEHRARLKLVKQ